MATTIKENLEEARNNMAALLAEITASPKPSYSVDGESWSWTQYQQFLITSIKELEVQIADADDEDGGIVAEQTQFYQG